MSSSSRIRIYFRNGYKFLTDKEFSVNANASCVIVWTVREFFQISLRILVSWFGDHYIGQNGSSQIVIRGFASLSFVYTALLNMYARLQEIQDSFKVFNTMTEFNVVSWNAMISVFTLNGLYSEACDHFLRMKGEGVTPDAQSFIGIAKAMDVLGDVSKAKEVSHFASLLGVDSNTLVDMHSKCRSLQEADPSLTLILQIVGLTSRGMQ
ncbi:Pentatricopeptide repeat-containing protein, partial [Cucurbita argyrosperma subsp. argyrosperma]